MPKTYMNHDVDYCVETIQDIDALNRRVDDLRLEAMAALEELDQLLSKNETLARSKGWSVYAIQGHLKSIVDTLRTKI
ncbi:MAG: hypothetical protein HC840_00525 [Leptolyngbyaceae cyanobacterium RM2_2_4]|nr:hypothetical protein [Leptolyngbyaceae cyanobacterium RM2_2_4]